MELGSRTLKDAINEALRDWTANVLTTHYSIGSVVGPHPYPMIVRDLQSATGHEIRDQITGQVGRLPDVLLACVGGGSNAMGTFHPFLDDDVAMHGVEAGGAGLAMGQTMRRRRAQDQRANSTACRRNLLQDADGQVQPTHSISAGLDYPGVGPEHVFLKHENRVMFRPTVNDTQALEAFLELSRTEGIPPAFASQHTPSPTPLGLRLRDIWMTSSAVMLSGRGDKDVEVVARRVGADL